MADRVIEAVLAFRGSGQGAVGRDRIAMLEAVDSCGSITKAAKKLGLSYKAVWDGISAINNLLPRPALIAQTGGRSGGGAELTEEGRQLIRGFRKLEEKLSRVSRAMAEAGVDLASDLPFWSFAMKTSARNAFRCQVAEVKRAAVNVEVVLRVSERNSIAAVITNESADDLDLAPGREVVALVKSSFVMLARAEEAPRIATPNLMCGEVIRRTDGGVNSEVVLDIGDGKTLTSVVTKDSVDDLGIGVGVRLCAFFMPSHVILATD